jgi:hypothetical protein
MEGELSASRSSRFWTRWISWMSLRAGLWTLEDKKNALPVAEVEQTYLGREAPSVCWLLYHDSRMGAEGPGGGGEKK